MTKENKTKRTSEFFRKTAETEIRGRIGLDGRGDAAVRTGIPFFDHLLKNFAKFSGFDVVLDAKGDLDVDFHHTVEDAGIALGGALKEALGSREGIVRLGFCYVPFDDALVRACVDVSGRPDFQFECPKPLAFEAVEFLRAFAFNSFVTVSIDVLRGGNEHHVLEAAFKALGRALGDASRIDSRIKGVLSVK